MLTIGLPFYNASKTLAWAIQSVFAQSYQDWELLLVDDGSTDHSVEIARNIQDDRVRVYSDGKNKGLATRLNQIAEMANGRYLARMDADDLMHPGRLSQQLLTFEADPQLDLVDTGLLSINELNQPMGLRCCHPLDVSRLGLLRGQIPVHASIVAKTEWYRRNQYNGNLERAQDFELWNRSYAESGWQHARVTKPLYFARESAVGSYRKARATHTVRRQVLRSLGTPNVGWQKTQVELFKTNAKQAAHLVASYLRMDHHIIARRNRPIETGQAHAFRKVIQQILETPVPGLTRTQVAA